MKYNIRLLALFLLTATLGVAEVFQEAYLKPSNNAVIDTEVLVESGVDPFSGLSLAQDLFGFAVALSGDTLVVGAPFEDGDAAGDQSDPNQYLTGAAYVFTRSGNAWSFQAYLKASPILTGANFGEAVAIDGDTLAVGSPPANVVVVFTRTGTNWTQQAVLQPPVVDFGDDFGAALALQGDTLVVGAPNEDGGIGGINGDATDDSADNAGAAYIFDRVGTNWTATAYLKPLLPGEDDAFGTTVALSGSRIAVGAPEEDSAATGVAGNSADNSASNAGAVYLFAKLPMGGWIPGSYIKASNTDAGDSFGTAVALDGDLLAVGAPDEDSGATGINGDESDDSESNAGAVYVFREAGGWSQEAYVKAAFPDGSDAFGQALALSGSALVIGAPLEDGVSTGIDGDADNNDVDGAGAAYVCRRDGAGTWTQDHYVKPAYISEVVPFSPIPTDPCAFQDPNLLLGAFFAVGTTFGTAVTIDGTSVVVGAPLDDSSASGVNGDPTNRDAPDSGAAYAFDLAYTDPSILPDLSVQHPPTRDLISGDAEVAFGLVAQGNSETLIFALVNRGGSVLTGLTVSVTGSNTADFAAGITTSPDLAPDTGTLFDVAFSPTGPGLREAALTVTSNDPDENPFTVPLNGYGTQVDTDTDGDGMTDLAEWALRPIGFDWQIAQPGFVNRYYQTASAAGLYTVDQVATLVAPSLLLERDATTGRFGLTFDLQWSDDAFTYDDLPADPLGLGVDTNDNIRFEFEPPGGVDRALFRVNTTP